jgi:glyoxylase-like metal-dependent hydrolase (beta-lactamase superfamily II)
LLDQVLAAVPPAAVLLTHHHGDHIGGAVALAERWSVPIAAHAATARRLAGRVAVTQIIEDGETVYGATAIFTPGHAEGHLCYAVGDAIIAGDMVAGLGTILIDPSEGDMAVYLASLELLLARPPMTLLPAHGPAIPDGQQAAEYLAHRNRGPRWPPRCATGRGARRLVTPGVQQRRAPASPLAGDFALRIWKLGRRGARSGWHDGRGPGAARRQ